MMNRTVHEQIGLIAFFAVLLTFLGLAALLLAPFSGPLLCALSAAIILWPAHCWLTRQIPTTSRTLRASLSATAALLLVVGPLVAITLSAANEAAGVWPTVKDHLLAMKKQMDDPSASPAAWTSHLPAQLALYLELALSISQEKIIALGNHVAQKAAGIAASLTYNVLILIGNIFLFEFVLFFLLRDGNQLRRQWNDLLPFPEELKRRLQHRAESVVQGVFRGIVVVGLIQTAVLAIAYVIVGVPAFILLTALTAVVTLVPGIGTGLIWGPMMIYFFIKGIVWKGITLAAFGVFVGTSDNILRPLISGPTMNLSLLWFFLSLLGGLQFFGALGILLGPMIFAILPILLDVYRAYLDPLEY